MSNDKGFTEPLSMDQPIIGDDMNMMEGQTSYLGNEHQHAAATQPAQNQNRFYWQNGVLMDSTTGYPVPNQPTPPPAQAPTAPAPKAEDPSKPKTHLAELPDRFMVIIHVPGIPREQINIDFDEPILKVTGTRTNPLDEYKSEFASEFPEQTNVYYGDFKVSYKMTKNIDKVDATMEDGVLKIEAWYKAKAEATSISIK